MFRFETRAGSVIPKHSSKLLEGSERDYNAVQRVSPWRFYDNESSRSFLRVHGARRCQRVFSVSYAKSASNIWGITSAADYSRRIIPVGCLGDLSLNAVSAIDSRNPLSSPAEARLEESRIETDSSRSSMIMVRVLLTPWCRRLVKKRGRRHIGELVWL